jgi:hypothetical protein
MKTLVVGVVAIISSGILASLVLRTGLHYHTHGYMDLEEFAIITTSLLLPIWTFFHKMVQLFYADLRPRQIVNRRDRSRGWHITCVLPHSISQNLPLVVALRLHSSILLTTQVRVTSLEQLSLAKFIYLWIKKLMKVIKMFYGSIWYQSSKVKQVYFGNFDFYYTLFSKNVPKCRIYWIVKKRN